MNRTRKHNTPLRVRISLWILDKFINKTINPHETAAQIANVSTVEKLMSLSGTIKEAEQRCKEKRKWEAEVNVRL